MLRKLFMKITIISDTHGKHREVRFQETIDLLIHAGDFTKLVAYEKYLISWIGIQRSHILPRYWLVVTMISYWKKVPAYSNRSCQIILSI